MNCTQKICAGCAAAGVLAIASASRATVIAYDSFSGLTTSDTLGSQPAANNNSDGSGSPGWATTSQSTGNGELGGWLEGTAVTQSTVADGTVYTASASITTQTGNSQYINLSGTTIANGLDFRGLASTTSTAIGTTIYFSALIQRQDTKSRTMLISLYNNTWTTAGAGSVADMGDGGGGDWYFGSAASTISAATTAVTLLVGEMYFNGASSVENFWVNPTLGGAQPTPTATATVTLNSTDDVDGIRLFAGGEVGQPVFTSVNIYDIGIGTTWGDVVPEPASLAFMTLPALALLRRRRPSVAMVKKIERAVANAGKK